MPTVTIPKSEYKRLKKLDSRFRVLFDYLEYAADIRGARGEIKSRKIVAQEKLFKKLGL